MSKSKVKRIDWEAFYRKLDSWTVPIPEPAPGEPHDLVGLMRLFAKVQNNREAAERFLRTVTFVLAKLNRKIGIAEHALRMERAVLLDDPSWNWSDIPKSQYASRLDELTSAKLGAIVLLKAYRTDYDAAKDALNVTVKSLEKSKETLNAIKSIALSEMSPSANDDRQRGTRRF